jgi:putative endonuclease
MSMWRRRRGQHGEQLAVDYLEHQGWRIQQRNFRCRQGEIDIVAWDGATLVFIEVKTKSHAAFGAPQAMVGRRKQHTIAHVAMTYIQRHRIRDVAVRFDVVAITVPAGGAAEVTHIPAAFSPPDYFCY